tara:strand:- start:864 stop:1394 length:531 start_codon:yes stop_codon:yes gene_type:complete
MKLNVEVEVPEGFRAEKKEGELVVTKGDKSLRRALPRRKLSVKITGNKVSFSVVDKKDRALVGTFVSHIKNMIAGLTEPFTYKLKVCSTHFPMSVKIEGNVIVIQNFIGSKAPIKAKMPENVEAKIEGDIITLASPDIELAGMAASRIEQATRMNKRDRRIFQDGIFMIKKAKKEI